MNATRISIFLASTNYKANEELHNKLFCGRKKTRETGGGRCALAINILSAAKLEKTRTLFLKISK
jgi:hypothetical protein